MSGQTVVDYASLEQAVQDYLTRSDLTDLTFLPEILQMGQDRIFKGFTDNRGNYFPGLRIRAMLKSLPYGAIETITLGGTLTGYTGTVLGVTFAAPPAGGVQATGYGVITNGKLTAVVLTNPGQGYTSAPIATPASGAATITVTISTAADISPSNNYAVPADYLELDYINVITQQGPFRLETKAAEWVYRYYGSNNTPGVPNYVARDGSVFIFAPGIGSPGTNAGYGLSGEYYALPAYLSATNTSNFLTTTYPALLLAACLAEATAFVRDWAANAQWESRFLTLINSVRMGDRNERFSGGPLAMLPG